MSQTVCELASSADGGLACAIRQMFARPTSISRRRGWYAWVKDLGWIVHLPLEQTSRRRRRLKSRLALVAMLTGVCLMTAASQPQTPQPAIQYVDVTKAAGLTFRHNSGALGKKYLPETLGPGVAFIDYNGDGWQDLFFTNGKDWPGQRRRPSTLELYKNNQNGTFSNVTSASGLAREVYGMGTAVGDFDNDGDPDLFVSTLGQSLLFRNTNGVFQDITKEAGLFGPDEFSTSAAWLDYDKDGHLDLYVANYVQWTPATDIRCTLDGTEKSYCTPESYKGSSARLWRNKGNGTFQDVTKEAGVLDPTSKGLGVTVLDVNQDSWPDLLLANDTQPNRLYINSGKGTLHGKGSPVGHRVQRTRQCARRHGCRSGRLRSVGFSQRPDHQLLQRNARPLSQRRQRALCRRSAAIGSRAIEPADTGIRMLLLRLRSRRMAGYLCRQRAYRTGN